VAVVLSALGTVLAVLADLWRMTGHLLASPSGPPTMAVTVLAVAVLVGALSWLARGGRLARIAAAVPQLSRAAALREKSRRAGYLRQRDPGGSGRPRPRAPSAARTAAR
jgi:uncharacterized protein DUF6412